MQRDALRIATTYYGNKLQVMGPPQEVAHPNAQVAYLLASSYLANNRAIGLPTMERVKNHLGQSVVGYTFTGEQGCLDSIVVVEQCYPLSLQVRLPNVGTN